MSCQNVLSSQNLIPCFLTFSSTINYKFNPYLPFEFFIILVSLLLYMLSIHNNLSAGTQNVTGTYVHNNLQAPVNNVLTWQYFPSKYIRKGVWFTRLWQSSCVIANNARKTTKAISPRL